MYNILFVFLQYIIPHNLLSRMVGIFAKSEVLYIKLAFIKTFQMIYDVNMKEALYDDISSYSNFNSFFTRPLKPESRPIDKRENSIVSPVDGVVSQIGLIKSGKIIQAKGMYFNLLNFLGNDKILFDEIKEGLFSTFYLSPKDYHRVHMPFDGKLRQMIYLPGKLYSVNSITTQSVNDLYSKNERLVCRFDTVRGPMVVVLVGAMIVAGIRVNWNSEDFFNNGKIQKFIYPTIGKGSVAFKKGDEIGRFMLGSTVVICFGKGKINWSNNISTNSSVRMGQSIGFS